MRRYAGLLLYGGRRRTGVSPPPTVWRRLFHLLAGSCLPLAGLFAPPPVMLAALAALAGAALLSDLARFALPAANRRYMRLLAPLLKADEEARITGATYMCLAALLAFALFGKEAAVPALFYLSLGDPAAALVGRRAPGPRIYGKSPAGTLAFAAVASAAAAVLVGAGALEFHWALWAGAVIAALLELASIPPDDNLWIPLLAGLAMWLLLPL